MEMTPIQRLAVRKLRLDGFSYTQIAAIVGCSSSAVVGVTANVASENLPTITLREIGSPGNMALFASLSAAVDEFIAMRRSRLSIARPNGLIYVE